ncbi:MAG: hypothetical protein V3V08_17935 [Nannocystaceae bacterium]
MAHAPLVALALSLTLFSAPPESSTLKLRDEAATLFASGVEAFERKDFAVAASDFDRAQQLAPHPYTLYNLALAREQSGDLTAAWAGYVEVEATGTTRRDRDDAARDRQRIETRLAVLEIHAVPRERICLDATPIKPTASGQYRAAALEGDHVLVLDEHVMPITLLSGHTRVLHLQGIDDLLGWNRARPSDRAQLIVQSAAAGTAFLALVLGSFAVARRPADAPGNGLLTGAVLSAGLAAATGLAAALQLTSTPRPARRGRATLGLLTDPASCTIDPNLAAPHVPKGRETAADSNGRTGMNVRPRGYAWRHVRSKRSGPGQEDPVRSKRHRGGSRQSTHTHMADGQHSDPSRHQ